MNNNLFNNKVAFVTGSTRGIGLSIAEKLSGPNVEIIIHFNKSKSKAENLKNKLEKFGTKID